MSEPTVFVVDDNEGMRNSLSDLIQTVRLPVKTFCSALEFLETYVPGEPGCLLLDVRMPGMSGLELQKRLAEKTIDLPVIMITGHADVDMAVEAMKRGAYDFIQKPIRAQPLLECLHHCLEENALRRLRNSRMEEDRARLSLLSARERQVMSLVVAGKSSKQIAWELSIAKKTVEAHRARIMRRTGVRSVTELVALAINSGYEGDPASN